MPGMHRLYATDQYYSIVVGDGLVHGAFVKNTVHGAWFLAFCYLDTPNGVKIRGATEPCTDAVTCLECLEKGYG